MDFTDIYYCQTCGARVPPADVLSCAALVLPGENKIYCKACAPPDVHNAETETDLRPLDPSRDLLETIPVRKNERRSSRSMIPAQRSPGGAEGQRPGARQSKAPVLGLAVAGGMAVLAGAIFFFSSRKSVKETGKTQTDSATETVVDTPRKADVDYSKFAQSSNRVIEPWAAVCVLPMETPADVAEAQKAWALRRAQALFTPLNLWPATASPDVTVAAAVVVTAPTVVTPVTSNDVVLAKIGLEGFNGGRVLKDLAKKGADGKTLYGQGTSETTSTARFDLKLPVKGPATVLLNTVRWNKEPCMFSVEINGHEIFQNEEIGKEKEWIVQTIPVPAGIVQAGRNELRIVNKDPSKNFGAPQIIVGGAEIRGNPPAAPVVVPVEIKKPVPVPVNVPAASAEPVFPAIIDAQQRAAVQFIDNIFVSLSKYDLETAQRLAATDTTASGKQLTAVLAGAQTVFNKAVTAVNKSTVPLTVQASAGRLNVSGQVTRIEGAKAWIKDRGLEVSVDLSALPPELFFKALAANESSPDGRLEKALLHIALGNSSAAVTMMKKAGAHAPSADAVAVLNQYAQLTQLQKFDTEVNELSTAIRDGQTQDAAAKLKTLQQNYPELAKTQKERFAYLLSKLEKK